MIYYYRPFSFERKRLIILSLFTALLFSGVPVLGLEAPKIEAEKETALDAPPASHLLVIMSENTLIPMISPSNQRAKTSFHKVEVIVTAYNSTVEQTDSDPFITASGSTVRDGIVATNILPFGTHIRIPEYYGDKVFVVEDRMHYSKGNQVDIWFESYLDAVNFGAKRTYIEIL